MRAWPGSRLFIQAFVVLPSGAGSNRSTCCEPWVPVKMTSPTTSGPPRRMRVSARLEVPHEHHAALELGADLGPLLLGHVPQAVAHQMHHARLHGHRRPDRAQGIGEPFEAVPAGGGEGARHWLTMLTELK